MKKIIALLFALSLNFENADAQNCSFICNGDFESPIVTSNPGMMLSTALPCWETTASDGIVEVWSNGFGVLPYSGNQLLEINAYMYATIYQNFNAVPGQLLDVSFAHHGRAGIDTMRIEMGAVGGPYTTLATVADGGVWGYYTFNYNVPNSGNNYCIRFVSVYAAGNNPGLGNLLDAVTVCLSTVGINDQNSTSDFSIRGDNGQGIIEVTQAGQNNEELLIYDISGRMVVNKVLTAGRTIINSKNLIPGVYMARLKSGKGELSRKFIY
jgi:hypothetical protein